MESELLDDFQEKISAIVTDSESDQEAGLYLAIRYAAEYLGGVIMHAALVVAPQKVFAVEFIEGKVGRFGEVVSETESTFRINSVDAIMLLGAGRAVLSDILFDINKKQCRLYASLSAAAEAVSATMYGPHAISTAPPTGQCECGGFTEYIGDGVSHCTVCNEMVSDDDDD